MNVSIEQTIKDGVSIASNRYILILANSLIAGLTALASCITIIGILAVPAILGGYYESLIRVARNEPAEIGDFFKAGFDMWGRLFGLTIIVIIGVSIGLMLFVIPGIYLMVIWLFPTYLMVDNNLGIEEALKKSYHLITDVAGFWNAFALTIIVFIVNLILQIIPFIGLIWLIFGTPFIYMIFIVFYRDIVSSEGGKKVLAS